MRRLVQFVVLAVVALITVPPSLAGDICQMLQGGFHDEMQGCCASMGYAAMSDMRAESQMPASVQAQTCGNNCCTLSPQEPPFQTAPDKFKLDIAPAAHLTTGLAGPAPERHSVPSHAATDSARTPRHILLKTLRI